MKNLLPRTVLAIILAAVPVFAADEAIPRRLGDAAFYAGDYRNAVSSYKTALEIAGYTGNDDDWAACALNLASSYLHLDDIAGARKIFDEFRKRFPLRSSGTLHGDLLAAEGKYAQAEKFYNALVTEDPAMEDARLFSLASLYMKTGRLEEACRIFILLSGRQPQAWNAGESAKIGLELNSGNNTGAYRQLGKLIIRPETPWHHYAACEAAYVMIRLNRIADAREMLKQISADRRNAQVMLLEYLADAGEGRIDVLKRDFQAFLEKLPPNPHLRLMELFSVAAETALKQQDSAFAAALLEQALNFAVDTKVKMRLSRQFIDVQLSNLPAKAAEYAIKYCREFPQDPEKFEVALNAAGKLLESRNIRDALKVYDFLQTYSAIDRNRRLQAAEGALLAAEKLTDFAALAKTNELIIKHVSREESIFYRGRYAAFLEKNGKIQSAEKELSAALKSAEATGDDKMYESVMFHIMQFHLRNRNSVGVLDAAVKLEKSSDANYAAGAKYALGVLQELSYNHQKAREYFLSVSKLPANEFSAASAFKAALMANKESDFTTAANEYLAFAVKFPDYGKTPEALFMAVDLFDPANDEAKVRQAEELLREKYPDSQAFAVLVLRQTVARSHDSKNISAIIGDLKMVEKNFAGTPYVAEAMLLRAVFTDKQGDFAGALKILETLHGTKDTRIAAESLLRSGEIYFRRNEFGKAKEYFDRAAAMVPELRSGNIALLRAVDCRMAEKAPLDGTILKECESKLNELIKNTKFPQIRLEAAHKLGIVMELQNRKAEALSGYEKTIYVAMDMDQQGLNPDRSWCMRSCESALRLLGETPVEPGALQRGMQLIDRCARVFGNDSTIALMRDMFRKQINKNKKLKK